jgi:hypothetical protein
LPIGLSTRGSLSRRKRDSFAAGAHDYRRLRAHIEITMTTV